MKIDVKILDEINRYKKINTYISEQDAPPPAPTGDEGATPPPAPTTDAPAPAPTDTPTPPTDTKEPEKVDLDTDKDVEKVGDESKNKKEIEVTDLVKSQKIYKQNKMTTLIIFLNL